MSFTCSFSKPTLIPIITICITVVSFKMLFRYSRNKRDTLVCSRDERTLLCAVGTKGTLLCALGTKGTLLCAIGTKETLLYALGTKGTLLCALGTKGALLCTLGTKGALLCALVMYRIFFALILGVQKFIDWLQCRNWNLKQNKAT